MSNQDCSVSIDSIICECGDEFKNEDLFNAHSDVCRYFAEEIQEEKEYKCELCHAIFAEHSLLDAHTVKVHVNVDNKKPFRVRGRSSQGKSRICEVCGYTCASAASLVYHMRTHTGERPYECPYCPKRFTMQMLLQTHIRVHTGEKPYECKECPKAFGNKAAINRHMRVHTGAKPYPCPECGKCFSQSNSTKLHYKTVHLKLPTPYKKKPKNAKSVVKTEEIIIESTVYPTTEGHYEDGTEISQDGTVISEDGTVISEDGTVISEDGTEPLEDDYERIQATTIKRVPIKPVKNLDFFDLKNRFMLKGKKIRLVKVVSQPVTRTPVKEPKYSWQNNRRS